MKKCIFYLSILFILFCAVGCKNGTEQNINKDYLYTVTDATGNNLSFQHSPQRIVSYSISTDEILLDMLSPNRIIAVTHFADDPMISNVSDKCKLVPYRVNSTSAETIMSWNPDLIIVPDFIKPEIIQTLQDLKLKVYVYKTPHTIKEVKEVIKNIAALTGDDAAAHPLIENMDKRLKIVEEKLKNLSISEQKRVAFMRDDGVYYSDKTSFRDVCQYAKVYDVTKDIKYSGSGHLTQEELVRLNPDIFIIADWNYDGNHYTENMKHSILSNPAYENTGAGRDRNVIALKGANILCVSQYMADAVVEMAEKVYPERFDK